MKTDRRHFLKMVGTAGAGVVVAACSGPAGTSSGPLKAADVKLGQIVPLANAPAFVVRDAAGLYAMTSVCAHQNCDMTTSGQISGSRITCACHGSQFDASGTVLTGPATTSLNHLELTVAVDGTISVNTGKTVPNATRVKA